MSLIRKLAGALVLALGIAGASRCFADEAVSASGNDDSTKPNPSPRALQPSSPPISKPATTAAPKDIQLSFKLDPRLTRGLYMGDRWVSPPSYQKVGEGKDCSVEVRAYVVDALGRPLKVSPKWTSADSETAAVSPGQGSEVKITVKRAGETNLELVAQGLSRKLSLKAVAHGDTLQMEFTQHAVARRAGTEVHASATK
jgi:hypothetical protein